MKIKIVINRNNTIKSIYADDSTNEFTIGDIEIGKGISTFIQTAINLVKDWPEKIESENKDFTMYYQIAYDDGTNIKQISCEGEFPKDFYKLSNLIFSYEDPVLYKTQQSLIERGEF